MLQTVITAQRQGHLTRGHLEKVPACPESFSLFFIEMDSRFRGNDNYFIGNSL